MPGQPAESELIFRINAKEEDEVMPPSDSHKKLSARDKAVLELWIQQGAAYQKHWSYEPPVKAEIAAGANGVDVLVARRLATIGMKASPDKPLPPANPVS